MEAARFCLRCCLLLGSALAAPALADSAPDTESSPVQTLPFAEALRRAAAAPAVRAAHDAAARKAQLDAHLPALTMNPQLGVQAGYRALSAPERGAEVQVNLWQSFNLAGHAGARRRAAASEDASLRAEASALLLAQRLGAARAWLLLWGAQEALAEARREVGLAAEFTRRMERAAAATLYTRADLAEAAAYQAEAELLALALSGEVFELGVELAQQVGAPDGAPLGAAGPLPQPANPPQAALAQVQARLGDLPAVHLRHLLAVAEGARERELRAARGTQLQAGLHLLREAPAALVAMGSLTLTAPIFDRGERERAALSASQLRLAGEAEGQARRAAAELVLAFHEVEHTAEVHRQMAQHLVPATAESARLREASMRAGEGTVLELLVARRAAALSRGRQARALAGHVLARARLWLIWQAVIEAADHGGPR